MLKTLRGLTSLEVKMISLGFFNEEILREVTFIFSGF
jgi:hypothetical protein